ncbi:MAG TPA: 2-oxo-4-hydroxy-4-carboxy-5-ureidoimidazoline decarboxylase [Solirubrobacteraceae bacterium]|jgi:OHCU decarboxylase|nr:2-oxo-4-hydroxy-4-carboxy-5-ureidoimidazoline decarboxylase [Solirubrobacteraceae bacterium]
MTDTGVATTADGLAAAGTHEALAGCCASERWITEMERGRPFASAEAMLTRCEAAFDALGREDWLQAFAAHSRIGAPRAGDARGSAEQAGTASASAEEMAALAAGNERYQARFGHVFLIRASGLGAGEMLAALEERLGHTPEQELTIAAAQQREITRLRLRALLTP